MFTNLKFTLTTLLLTLIFLVSGAHQTHAQVVTTNPNQIIGYMVSDKYTDSYGDVFEGTKIPIFNEYNVDQDSFEGSSGYQSDNTTGAGDVHETWTQSHRSFSISCHRNYIYDANKQPYPYTMYTNCGALSDLDQFYNTNDDSWYLDWPEDNGFTSISLTSHNNVNIQCGDPDVYNPSMYGSYTYTLTGPGTWTTKDVPADCVGNLASSPGLPVFRYATVTVTQVVTPPLNLATSTVGSSGNFMTKLDWTPSTSTDQTAQFIERATSTNSFEIIATTSPTTNTFTDNMAGSATGTDPNMLPLLESTNAKTLAYTNIKYQILAHYPNVLTDGSTEDDISDHDNYYNDAYGRTECNSEMVALYNSLPNDFSGTIHLSVGLKAMLTAVNGVSSFIHVITLGTTNKQTPSDSIRYIMASMGLPGKDLGTAINQAVQMLEARGPWILISDPPVSFSSEKDLESDYNYTSGRYGGFMQEPEIIRNKFINFLPDAIQQLGKNLHLNSEETDILFGGIRGGDIFFTINSLTFDSGNFTYDISKATPTPSCYTTSFNGNIGPFISALYDGVKASTITPPSISSISNNGSPNAYTLNGSGFSSSNNSISLTPSGSASAGPSSLAPSKNTSLLASIHPAIQPVTGIVQSIINILIPSNNAPVGPPTPATTTPTTTTPIILNPTVNGYYEIDGIPSDNADGTSITFTVPNTVPDGVYTVGAASEASDWTQTPFTITVTGNGAGDPTTIIGADTATSTSTSTPPVPDLSQVFIDSTSTTATSTYLVWYSPSATLLGYEVSEISPDTLTIVGTTTDTGFLWSGLNPDTNYCVSVYTLDSSGTNATSSTCFTTTILTGDQSTGVDVYDPVTVTPLPVPIDTTTTNTPVFTPAIKKILLPPPSSTTTTVTSTSTSGLTLVATSTTDSSTIYVWDGGVVTIDCGLGYVMVNGACQFGTDSGSLSSISGGSTIIINGVAISSYTGVYGNEYYINSVASTTYKGTVIDPLSGNTYTFSSGIGTITTCLSSKQHPNSAGTGCIASSSLIEI